MQWLQKFNMSLPATRRNKKIIVLKYGHNNF
uniref:Uncharacterized protein n=1 Tax=Myoviridae sp. ct2Pw37 TaxID=2825021 RepID=A0A8S5PBS3_9CAUD|nr:MAG TPA: hypothetical protein [Myoviridae sp. ct2Pw37]DAI07415.1 MAG TPA: hypothetical protein [Bacteriophage sp.]DAT05040.1 MAG TPA: hypothetical protein [Caudoviricetes sp.]